jgi:hypothetical protein
MTDCDDEDVDDNLQNHNDIVEKHHHHHHHQQEEVNMVFTKKKHFTHFCNDLFLLID